MSLATGIAPGREAGAAGIADLLRSGPAGLPALLRPEHPSLSHGGLRAAVERVAAALRERGVRPGDRVLVASAVGSVQAVAMLAAATVAQAVPACPHDRPEQAHFLLDALRPALAILDPGKPTPCRELVAAQGIPVLEAVPDHRPIPGVFHLSGPPLRRDVAEVQGNDRGVALVLATAGGDEPLRLVSLTHRNLMAAARQASEGLGLAGSDCVLNLLPPDSVHSFTLGVLAPLAASASVLADRPGAGSAPRPGGDDARPTVVLASAAQYREILASPRGWPWPTRGLRLLVSTGAPLHPGQAEALEQQAGAPLLEVYGMAEAAGFAAIARRGLCLAGGETRLVAVDEHAEPVAEGMAGDIAIRGPQVFDGYGAGALRATDGLNEGWFLTGDRGRAAADGALRVEGRLGLPILRLNRQVVPLDVEQVLEACPGVAQSCVVEIRRPEGSPLIGAAIQPQPGAVPDLGALRSAVVRHLGIAAVPAEFQVMERLPGTPLGRPARRQVAQAWTAMLARQSGGRGRG